MTHPFLTNVSNVFEQMRKLYLVYLDLLSHIYCFRLKETECSITVYALYVMHVLYCVDKGKD